MKIWIRFANAFFLLCVCYAYATNLLSGWFQALKVDNTLFFVCCVIGVLFLELWLVLDKKWKTLSLIGCLFATGAIAFYFKHKDTFTEANFEEILIKTSIVAILCLISVFLTEYFSRFSTGKMVCSILLLVLMIPMAYLGKEIPKYGVMSTGIILILTLMEMTAVKRAITRAELDRYLSHLLFFVVPLFVLLCFSPSSKDPYQWTYVHKCYEFVQEQFVRIEESLSEHVADDFLVATTGFSDIGTLQERVLENEDVIMTIQTDRPLLTNLYLIGAVYDTFDGRSWSHQHEESGYERLLDSARSLYAVEEANDVMRTDLIQTGKVTVSYDRFHTEHIFTPLKTYRLDSESENLSLSDPKRNVLLGEKKGYDYKYSMKFAQLNVDHERFYDFLNGLSNNRVQPVHLADLDVPLDTIQADLDENEKMIYAQYGGKVFLSADVKALINQVTTGAQGDIEKLKCIEQMLSSYEYSLSPGKLPASITDESAFLDEFLFRKQKGYCSYFATAFVLIARSYGIPARYVEGICIPARNEKTIKVRNNMIHAWPEVYIKGFGWVPFEPTPGYEKVRYTPWKVSSKLEAGNITYATNASELGNYWGEKEQSKQSIEEMIQQQIDENEKESTVPIGKYVRILLLILLFMFTLLLVDKMIRRILFQRKSVREQYDVEFRKTMRVLKYLGFTPREGETLEEIGKKLQDFLLLQGDVTPLCFVTTYEKIRYGDKKVRLDDLLTLRREKELLLLYMPYRRAFLFREWLIYSV